ncbi:hypothetical protein [Oscillibacter sp.]|uniref:PBECR3 domain-containing polyvalent protein n=1 Tax=Oscillibacter sp. TaxID=1945593 RepID=UPI002897F066|nr:hypothetical protein [Oscillibacter sp.]
MAKLDIKFNNGGKTYSFDTATAKKKPVSVQEEMQDSDTHPNDPVTRMLIRDLSKQGRTSRVADTVSGALKSTAGGLMDAAGVLYQSGQNARSAGNQQILDEYKTTLYRAQRELSNMQIENARTPGAWGEVDLQAQRNILADARRKYDAMNKVVQGGVQEKATEAARDFAGGVTASGMQDVERAKEGMGKLGRLAVDVGVAGTQMVADVGMAAITGGSALVPMAARAFGGSTQDARQSGASFGQQVAYGLSNAALQVGTEKMFNVAAPFKKMFGAGVLDKALEKATAKLTGSAAGRAALSTLSEASEETVAGILDPLLRAATLGEKPEWDAGQILQESLVGGILGLAGSGVEIATQKRGNVAQEAPGATGRDAAGDLTAGPQTAPTEAVKSAANPNGLTALSEREQINLSSGKKNKIVSSFKDTVDFVRNALQNKQNSDRAYLGKVPDSVAQKVLSDTGVNISGYNAVLSSDAVRHMFKNHGDPIVESARGQVSLDPKTAANITLVLSNPDKVTFSNQTDAFGRPTLMFEKQIGDNYITAQAVTDGTKSLTTDTMYIRKKASPATVDEMQTSPNQTSETGSRSTLSINSIPSSNANVKNDILLDIFTGKKRLENGEFVDVPQPMGDTSWADGSLGSAQAGFSTLGMRGTEQASRLAQQNPYNQYQEAATALDREDYAKLFRYESQTEQKSLHLADELLYYKKDGQRTFLKDIDETAFSELCQSLDEATAWNGPQTDAAKMIQTELQGRSVNGEVTSEEYTNWLRVMSEHAQAGGQGTQAWAKYSRSSNENGFQSESDAWKRVEENVHLTHEQRQDVFRQIVKFDTQIESVEPGDTSAMKDLILQIGSERGVLRGVSGMQSEALKKLSDSALDALTFDELKTFAYASTSAISADTTPANLGQKLKTIQVLSMLSKPTTAGRNLVGNTTFYGIDAVSMNGATILDKVLSNITGTRSVAAEKPSLFNKASRDAFKRSLAEITLDVDMDGSESRYGTSTNRTFKASGNIAERFMSALERNQAYLLNATDEFYKGAARSTVDATQALVDSGKIKTSNGGYAAEQADNLAKYRTFQDNSRASVAIQTVHDLLNMFGVGDSGRTVGGRTIHAFGAGDIVAPFTKVAGNLVSRGADYSVFNAAKGIFEMGSVIKDAAGGKGVDPAKQARAVSDVSRGLTGSAIAAGFYAIAKAGLLRNADDDDDQNVAALNKAEGMTGTQLNLDALGRTLNGQSTEWQSGDTLLDLSSVEPLNVLMNIGTKAAQWDGNTGIVSKFGDAANALAESSADLPVLQNIGRGATDIFKYGRGYKEVIAEQTANTLASSVIPNIVAGVAKGTDDKVRSTYSSGTLGGNTVDMVKSKIPGLRQTLPTSVDNFGEEKTYGSSDAGNFLNAVFNPLGVNTYSQSKVSKELQSVREKTGDASIYPEKSAVGSSVSIDGEKLELTYDQRQKFQAFYGATNMAYMSTVMGSREYRSASADEKAEYLSEVKAYAYQSAKHRILGADTPSIVERYDGAAKQGIGFCTMYDYSRQANALTADKDKNGESITNSKKEKVIALIDSMDISVKAKDYLYYEVAEYKDTRSSYASWH